MGLNRQLANLPDAITTDTSNNVGIGGAANASFKLQVTGATNLTGALSGTSATFSGSLTIDTDTLFVDSTNNKVGIGTNIPLDNLHIAASEVGNVGISVQNTNASYSSQLRFLNSAGTEKAAVTYVQSTTSLNLNVNQIDALTIGSTGQVNISSSIASNTILNITNGTAGGSGILIQAGNSYANYAMKVLNAAGAEKLRLDGNGNLLVGYTTDMGYKFGVNGTSIFASSMIIGASSDAGITLVPASGTSKYQTAGDGGSGSIWHASIETTWANYENYGCSQMTFKTELKASGTSDTSVTQMVIRPTGDIRMTSLVGTGSRTVTADANGTLSASSDSSLKQEDTSHKIEGLAEILQLKPRAYKWLSDIEIRGENAATEIGFFANEVNPIIPSAAPKGNYDLYGFYDRAVIAALVKAIQEQQAQIQELKAEINELKNK